MDRSKTYIKMCDCEEIQAQRENYEGEVLKSYYYCHMHGLGCEDVKSTWLPRQDQLQEMILDFRYGNEKDIMLNGVIALIDDFQDWVLNDCTGLEWSHGIQVSMDQLWLAFVQKELHNKIWNGSEWIST